MIRKAAANSQNSEPNALTKQQQRVYEFIVHSQRERGFPPTVAEIQQEFGFASPYTVTCKLQALDKKRWIKVHPGRARGIELIAERAQRTLPVFGEVAAGNPIEALQQPLDEINIDQFSDFFRMPPEGPKGLYILKVRGQSMIEDGILDGDHLLIRPTHTARTGETVIARIDGEATVKRFQRTRTGISLIPANKDMEPIEVPPDRDFQIQGTVLGVIRRLSN